MKNKISAQKIISLVMTVIFIIALVTPIYGASGYDKDTKNDIKQLIEKVNSTIPTLLNKYNVQGTSITIIDNGKKVWSKGFGYADKSKGIQVSEDTIFQAASISKAVTAIGVMKLVQDGKLDLDAPVENYLTRWKLPEAKYSKDDVTIRRLLSHTAGLSVHGYAGYSPKTDGLDIVDSLSGKLNSAYEPKIIAEPGTAFIYSGGGFSILQLVVEEVTGMPFDKYMKEEILDKLDMKNSYYEYNQDMLDKVSKAYGVFGQEMPSYIFAEKAAAGLLTTSSDLASFCTYLLSPELNPILSAETINTIMQETKLKDGTTSMYGLGLWVFNAEDGSKVVNHRGDNRGWRADMTFIPETGEGIVTVTNGYLGSNIIRESSALWDEYRLGFKPSVYTAEEKKEAIIMTVSLGILILLLLYLIKASVDWKKGKRQFLFNKAPKKRTFAIVKLLIFVIAVLAYWYTFFAPWYDGGWVIAAFLPTGFIFASKMLTGCVAVLIAIALLPKVKIQEKHKSDIQEAKASL